MGKGAEKTYPFVKAGLDKIWYNRRKKDDKVRTGEKEFQNTEDQSNIYLKFPAILREKLKSGEIVFPLATKYDFVPVKAYRGIVREKDDYRKVDRQDFRSYAELGRKKTRGRRIDAAQPEYYGVSLFRKKEIVENQLHFPNPHKKMAEGHVFRDGGPQLTNESTEHVCWWLYEDADLSGFHISPEDKKDE